MMKGEDEGKRGRVRVEVNKGGKKERKKEEDRPAQQPRKRNREHCGDPTLGLFAIHS